MQIVNMDYISLLHPRVMSKLGAPRESQIGGIDKTLYLEIQSFQERGAAGFLYVRINALLGSYDHP
jgi:hypothetical protein